MALEKHEKVFSEAGSDSESLVLQVVDRRLGNAEWILLVESQESLTV